MGKESATRPDRFTVGETAPNRRLSGPQSRSGSFYERKISCPFPGTECHFIGRPGYSLATVPAG
jgi:hypothetical protein